MSKNPLLPIHIFSHGLGTDTCTLIKLAYDFRRWRAVIFPEGYRHIVIFSDLGLEYPETYAQIDDQAFMVRAMGFEFVHLKPSDGFHPNYVNTKTAAPSIDAWWKNAQCIGMTSGDKRCTDRWKVQPIWDYVSDLCERELGIEVNRPSNRKRGLVEYAQQVGDFLLTIGFAKGEESRMNKTEKLFGSAGGWKKYVDRAYPLIALGMDRTDCNQYWEKQDLEPPRPSNCMFCFFQSPYELVSLKKNYPDRWIQWTEIEKIKLRANADKEKNKGALGVYALDHYLDKAMKTIDAETGKPIADLNADELKNRVQYHGGCVKNAF